VRAREHRGISDFCSLNRYLQHSLVSGARVRYGAGMKKNVWRAATETGFIIFLFYSNLLMGEFTRSGIRRGRDLAWAIEDIFTVANFGIAAIAALIGYLVVEFLRKRL
jgi:hypothetical protein